MSESLRERVARAIVEPLREPLKLASIPERPLFPPFLAAADKAIEEVRRFHLDRAQPVFEVRAADAEDFLAQLAARLAHLDDLYSALGVKWGEDPFAAIANLLAGAPLLSHAKQIRVLCEVIEERERQDAEWGGPEHDDRHSPHDFARFVNGKTGRVYGYADTEANAVEARRRFVQIAALAVAAIESIDRKYPEAKEANRVAHA